VCTHTIYKIHFYVEIKITDSISNGFDLDKCYLGHDPEQYSRGFSRHLG